MKAILIEYPKCSTCKRANKWLESKGVSFAERNIVEKNPSADELKDWHERSGLELKRFFNSSGMLYREMNLKDKLSEMSDEEKIALLASNGMLVKRPLLLVGDKVLVGFKESEWDEVINENLK